MFIICDRDILIDATSPALYAISNKATVQALEGFLITADKDSRTLTICGYDMEKGVKVTISADDVQIAEGGAIIINASKLSSVLKNLPKGDVSLKTDENFIVSINSRTKKSEFTMHGLDGSSYPLLPELSGQASFKINRNILREMIAASHFAIAVNSSRPALNGALFEINQGNLNVIAVDGYRIAVRRNFGEAIVSDTPHLDLSFIVPGKSLSELLKLIGNSEEPAEIQLTRKHFIISFDNIIFFSRLIEGEFIDYKRSINIDDITTAVIDTKSFTESVERAALLTDDRQKSKVILTFVKNGNNDNDDDDGSNTVQITSSTTLGNTYEECDIVMDGHDIEIGFNHKYLVDALKACDDEKILLRLESPSKSMVILPYVADNAEGNSGDITETGNFLYLVMPVRL